jgi:putative hemolysin
MKHILTSTFLAIFIVLTSCTSPQTPPTPAPVSTGTSQPNMPNPASAYCEEQGYRLEIRTAADGSQAGYCIFPDGSECDEWAYFRGECGPFVPPPTPKFVDEPRAMPAASVPLPFAVLVNTGDQRGITAYDRSGLALGEWQTSPRTGQVHAAGSITDGIMSTPLVFWSWSMEDNSNNLNFNLGGNITSLFSITDPPVMVTSMVGVPSSPMIAYSTLQYEENGAVIRSKVYLGEYQSLSSTPPILVIESRESEYITPLAIRMADEKPVGIWFTYHMFGIGGTPALYTNNSGLYYFDVASNTIYTSLEAGKTLTDLSPNQAYAAWTDANSGDLQVTDLINGQTVSFSKLPESERSAGFGMVSPSGGYVAWEEGINLIPGEEAPVFTVRIGTMDGNILAEYPHVNFAKTSELGMETSIKLLGWLSDEVLLVGVSQLGEEGESVIVAVNVNASEVALFARGEFTGFAYP